MTIHCGLLLIGINLNLANFFAGGSIYTTALLLIMSYVFKFCWIHKAFIIYTLLIDICIQIQVYIGFGPLLIPARMAAFIIGVSLFTILGVHFKEYHQSVIHDIDKLHNHERIDKKVVTKPNRRHRRR